MKILIAEDETLIRLDLRAILERHGFTVCAEARDGVEAVELARSTQPDAALLDVRMPNLDGIEAARRIYAERPLPIVMLTAFRDRATIDKAVAAGVCPISRRQIAPIPKISTRKPIRPPRYGTLRTTPTKSRPTASTSKSSRTF